MKKVKITVLRRTLQEDLAKEYGAENLGRCPIFEEGQVFYGDWAKPEGFCDEAWKAIYQYVFALSHGEIKSCSIMKIGSENPELQSVHAMTDSVLLFSNWKQLMKSQKNRTKVM